MFKKRLGGLFFLNEYQLTEFDNMELKKKKKVEISSDNFSKCLAQKTGIKLILLDSTLLI